MDDRELLAAAIHRVYCAAYEKRFGKPYYTNGDYDLLEEAVKDYDRALADFIVEREQRFSEDLRTELETLKAKVRDLFSSNGFVMTSNEALPTNEIHRISDLMLEIKELCKE